MQNYTKTKFRATGSTRIGLHYDQHGQAYNTKDKVFIPTRGYRNYLAEKRRAQFEEDLRIFRQKLELEYKIYGEIEELELQEYLGMLEQYGKMFG